MSQSSHSRAIYLLLLPLLCFGMSINLTAQLDDSCSITVNGGISIESSPRPARMSFSIPYLDQVPWNNLDNIFLPDDRFVETELAAGQRSEFLIINNFDFDIANESIITGIEVRFIGEKTGLDTVRDRRIRLVNDMGEIIGENKSNRAIFGNEWNQDSLTNRGSWIYGSNQDTWESQLTPQIINSPSFGIAVQVENIGNEAAKLMLDQVMIRIHYIPAIDICQQHACLSIFTVPEDNVTDYYWSVSQGLVHQDSTNAPFIINVFADQSPFGSYEVCLTKTYESGEQSNCCRNIIYRPCELGTIGNFVWKDANGNGNQDAGEPGLDNIRVFLFNESEQYLEESITQNGGQYRFENVEPGNYFVHISNYDYCPTIGVGNSDNTDSDFLQAISPLMSRLVTVLPGQNIQSIDFGLINKGTISGLAWIDVDGSATINVNDILAEGIEVQLQNSSGVVLKSTVTREDGSYVFDDVPPGDYIIYFAFDSEFTNTEVGESLIDSELKTPVVMLDNGGELININAGVFRSSSIGDLVWFDENENGIFENNESGLEGIRVSLQSCNGTELDAVMTDSLGLYNFLEVPPGQYIICAESNRPDLRPLETIDFTITGNIACSNCTSIIENSIIDDLDFAMINAFVVIEANVWFDNNSNGTIDGGEVFANNVEVSVLDCNNNIVQTGTTNIDGLVRFENLLTGEYYLQIIAPNDEEFSLSSSISNANGLGSTDCVNVVSPGIAFNLGLVQLSSVGNFVWSDLNRNGIQDQDEPGIENVIISLMDCNGNLQNEVLTSADGLYEFVDIPPGDYIICADYDNDDFEPTLSGMGTTDTGSDFDDTSPNSCSACFSLLPNIIQDDIDFGYVRKQSDVVINLWEDVNFNASNDTENPVPNVTVSLFDCTGSLLRTTSSDANGMVVFDQLFLEQYYVEINLEEEFSIHPNGVFSNVNGLNTTDCFLLEEMGTSIGVPVVQLPTIGDFVWQDENGDGIQNTDEPGIPDLVVSLQDCNGVLVNQTTTDSEGLYSFIDVIPGEYIICLGNPGDFFEPTISTGDDTVNSDFDLASNTFCSSCFTVNAFDDNLDMDFGFIRDVSEIFVELWFDENDNGLFDNDESPAENIEVVLLDCNGNEVESENSDIDGVVNFLDVGLGDYYIQVNALNNFDFSTMTSITGANGIGTSDCFTVDLAGAELEVGFVSDVSEVFVEFWFDDNGNGFFDSDESPAENIEVALLDCTGNEVARLVSDNNGGATFLDVNLGDYYIQVTELNDFDFAPMTSITGANGTGTSDCFTVDLTGFELEVGFIGPASIGDFVWLDINDNGRQDPDEPGVEGVSLNLLNGAGIILETAISDADGQYLFEDLDPGIYRIIIIGLDPSFTLTRPDQASEDSDSDFEMINTLISSPIISLNSGEINLDVDLGLVPAPSQIAGLIWRDANGNMLNDNEVGQEGLMVSLFDCNDNFIEETQTDTNGEFVFENISVGDYYINVTENSEFQFIQGGDSDITNDNGSETTECFSVDGSENLIEIGATPMSTMRAQVFVDVNENGILESTDSGLSGIGVILRDKADNEIEMKATDIEGQVEFDNINPGQYRLELIDVESGLAPTLEGVSTEELDSDLILEGGRFITDDIDIFDGINREDIDLGLVWLTSGKITGNIWRDSNGDLLNDNEDGIESIVVNLFNCNDELIESVETNIEGDFQFDDISNGEYYIQIEKVSGFELESGINSDFTSLSSQGETTCFVIENTTLVNLEAALIPLSTIGDFVWLDSNMNGQQDTDEIGVENIQLQLLNDNDEVLNSTFTNTDGGYSFIDLLPGFYKIELIGFENLYNATMPDLAVEGLDSDLIVDGNRLLTESLYVFDGDDNDEVDLGLTNVQTIIGGITFSDNNEDGIKDLSENGIASVMVSLLDVSGNEILNTTTNSDGAYNFVDIPGGEYVVKFQELSNLEFTSSFVGTDDLIDSDVIKINGETDVINIDEGQVINGINAGYINEEFVPQELSINGFVWEDSNGNGLFDLSNELGENGIVVNLFSIDNVLVSSVVSSSRNDGRIGYYSFDDLIPGDYYVEFELLSDAVATESFVGNSSEFDSNINTDFRSEVLPLTNLIIENVNAGYYLYATIGDYIWMDTNDNGFQDITEIGVNDYEIRLVDSNDNLIATTSSISGANGSGFYQFENVAPGNYYIRIDLQMGILFSNPLSGGIDLDSDITNENGFGTTYSFDVMSGVNIQNIDLGLVPMPAQVGDRVWEDLNANGMQDTNEPGVNNVTVQLYRPDGTLVDETITETIDFVSGTYSFSNIQPGEYFIAFDFDQDFKISPSNEGGDDSIDSDINGDLGPGTTSIFELSAGEIDLDVDGGIYRSSQIGDLVWSDFNLNGIQDAGENGIQGLEVRLFNSINDELLATVFTDNEGHYLFNEIIEGSYYLQFVLTGDLSFTEKEQGNNINIDSNVNAEGFTEIFDLENRQVRRDFDAGIISTVNLIGGQTWFDANNDGVMNDNDEALSNVTVYLLDAAASMVLDETESDENGEYMFFDITNGAYIIQFAPLTGRAFTGKDFGNDDTIDSDCDASGFTDKMILATNSTMNRNVSAGYVDITRQQLTNIYPNPVNGDVFKLDIKNIFEDVEAEYTLYNNQGNIARKEKISDSLRAGEYSYSVPLDGLDSGMYLLKVKIRNVTEYHRVLIFR